MTNDDLSTLIEPDDLLTKQCKELRARIRRDFTEARVRASNWMPRPCPPK